MATHKQDVDEANEVNFTSVYKGVRELPESELAFLAEWLLSQPEVDGYTKGIAEAYMKSGESDQLAYGLVAFELRGDLTNFSNAQPLTAEYSKEDAYRLFRLGFLLAALNVNAMQQSLNGHPTVGSPAIQRCPYRP